MQRFEVHLNIKTFQKWACPYYCTSSNMSLLNEDMWPSLPRTHALFAETPLSEKEINKCFCKSLNIKSVRVIKDFFRDGF